MHCLFMPLQMAAAIQEVVERISPYVVWGFVGVSALVIIVDIVLYTNDVEGDTVSNIIRDWAYGKGLVLPFIWGVLATHFFLVGPSTVQRLQGWLVIAGIIVVMILVGVLRKPHTTPFTQVLLLVFGVLAAYLMTF